MLVHTLYTYVGHEALRSKPVFGVGNDTDVILLSKVNCTGNEERLIDCFYAIPHLCFHSEDIAVICNTIIPGSGA